MNCPQCGCEISFVIDSRFKNGYKKRRRECSSCGFRYNTVEHFEKDYLITQKKIKRILQRMQEIKNICEVYFENTDFEDQG